MSLLVRSQLGNLVGWHRLVLALVLSLSLCSCGGGGSGGGGGASSGYTIGGHLTGLASGQQIILQDNGTDALTLAMSGPFTFSTEVAGGGNYSVTITAQPTGGTCVVSNGAGTNVNANVSNVTVTCSVHMYTVGGNLVGLASGQEVTLQDNGADPLTLKTSGPFTFSTQIPYGSSYSVSVSSQPSQASQQFCSLSNGNGTVSEAVTNVQVDCITESVLYDFTTANSANGAYPDGSLIVDAAGNLYGTAGGGSGGFGVVFKLSPVSGGGYTESVLYAFPGQPFTSDGLYPTGGVIMDSVGNLYGSTTGGGSNDVGVVFKLSPSAGGGYTESVLYTFTGSTGDGGEPTGGLIMDSAGNLYCTTRIGGTAQKGTVFKLSPSAGGGYTGSILYSFTGGSDGAQPAAGLIIDSTGNLYGTTSSAQSGTGFFGSVFKLAPAAGGGYIESDLHTFTGMNDGATPQAGLLMDGAGNLYGTTQNGSGSLGAGNGTVFKLARTTSGGYVESTIYSFTGGSDGANPMGGLVMDTSGNLYGTASIGGASTNCSNGCGTVFKLSPAAVGYSKSTLYSFSGGTLGSGPAAALIMDSTGNLYGTTSSGNGINVTGGTDAGNVFELLLH